MIKLSFVVDGQTNIDYAAQISRDAEITSPRGVIPCFERIQNGPIFVLRLKSY